MTRGPGRFLRWLASIFVRGPASRFVLGDLDEAMMRDLERGMSIWRARGRYLRNLVASSLALASARVRLRAPNLPSVMSNKATMDNSILALRIALRNMLRAPGTALAVLITLGLGIGPTTMMYGVADRVLLSPPSGITQSERVVRIFVDRVSSITHARRTDPSFSYPDLLDFEGLPAFQSVAGYANEERTLGAGADAERIRVQLAGAALFPLLGTRPQVGRFYSEEEEDRATGGSMVAVLSDAFWTRRFGRDPTVIGRDLRIGSALFTVIGVAPRGFTGASIEPVDAWLPLRTTMAAGDRPKWARIRGWFWLQAVARLRLADGVGRERAEAEATHAHRIGNERMAGGSYAPNTRVLLFPVIPGQAPDAGPEVTVARWLISVAVLVMVIACANVANLMLLRSVRRRREMAIRVAVGLGGGMLLVQLVVESAIYAALAATSALLLARWGAALVYRLLLPQLDPGGVFDSPGLMLFTAAVAALAAGLSVFLPLILSTRRNVIGDLREGGRGRASHRLRSGLTILQVTLSVVLLVGAGVFLRSLDRISELDLGFSPSGVILASVETSDGLRSEASARAVSSALSKLAGARGVESGAASLVAPFTGSYTLPLLTVAGDSIRPPLGPYFNVISPGYFHVMGMHIVQGRAFAREDTIAGAPPVMIVTQELARRVFGHQDPLGECLVVTQREGGPAPCTRVVGVIADHRMKALEEPPEPLYYLPEGHPASPGPGVVSLLTVRPSGHSDVAVAAARKALLEAGPDVRYVSLELLSDHVDALSRSWALGATLLLVFGGLALTVAALGLYAVLAFEIAERDPEFSLRSALGASPGRVVGMVFEATMTRVMLGTAIGFAGVAALSSYVQGLLFRTSPTDPVVLGAVGGVMLAVAAASTARPAIRAARARPADALRGAP